MKPFTIKNYRIVLPLVVLLLSVMAVLPSINNAMSPILTDKINLGLDLRGGAQLVLEVDMKAYQKGLMQQHLKQFRKLLRSNNNRYQRLKLRGNQGYNHTAAIVMRFANDSDLQSAQKLLSQEFKQLNFAINGNELHAVINSRELIKLQQQILNQSVEIVRRRVDEYGNKEISLQTVSNNRIDLQVPGLDNPDQLKQLVGKTAKLTFHLVNDAASKLGSSPANSVRLAHADGEMDSKLTVFKEQLLTGEMLTDAQASFQQGRPVVSFKLNSNGALAFAEVTKRHVGSRFAIVLDNKIISAPVIREPITGGASVISGNFTAATAGDLALLLRAGALPAPLKVVEERTLGPSIGADAINNGIKSTAFGFAAVVLFMLVVYGWFGVIASVALVANIVILFAVLSWFQSTLTLPGIAGVVLTIGMAVDANVLIFERIKEELKIGKSLVHGVVQGFDRAWSAIVDSNITTLIIAALLYLFGSGPIKGFAVTISIGLLISLYTAVALTKLVIEFWCNRQYHREHR